MSRYQRLHDRGVILPDDAIDLVLDALTQGAQEARNWLNIPSSEKGPKLVFLREGNRIGYAVGAGAINVPIPYLNSLVQYPSLKHLRTSPYHWTGVGKEISYLSLLVLGGREETIHHYQELGNPQLKARANLNTASLGLSELEVLGCDFEVEARRVVDQISRSLGQPPFWEDLDRYLQAVLGDRYNRPLSFYQR